MILIDEVKKYTLNEFLRILSHMQDKDYQTRIWIKNEGPECQAFDDAVCDFFDIGDQILNDYKSFRMTDAQYKLLKKLRDEFRVFSDNNDNPEEFIGTPKWERIIYLVKDVLKAFDYKS